MARVWAFALTQPVIYGWRCLQCQVGRRWRGPHLPGITADCAHLWKSSVHSLSLSLCRLTHVWSLKVGPPAADSLLFLSQAGPGTAGRAGIRGRTQWFACSQAGHPGSRMPPAVRWSAWSTGWLWIFGAALGQCLGYGSEQQRVAFLQRPGQNHLQASYMELRPSQVMFL